ncbi:hypothetical protein DC3_39670 [Deinococcus cellulosilyticus NBRC 106333 = KACC 11606]|uniref:Uncharacterized protein n=2 Tax=Deinococcus cellulosilyticus TaxID=401558 RepID=A0A511N637_DEIC1|nr:hypothetical protein DC3_39670 [Deinococcus cellulosilyticus NBRC 106333 = KACC 11606]
MPLLFIGILVLALWSGRQERRQRNTPDEPREISLQLLLGNKERP